MNYLVFSRPSKLFTIGLAVGLTAGLCGCRSEPEAEIAADSGTEIVAKDSGLDADNLVVLEDSEMPSSLPDAVIMLETMRDNIRDGLVNDDIDVAHGPLHEVGHLLEHLQKLVADSDISDDQKMIASEAIEQLFDSFGSIDELIHDDQPVDYSAYQDDIDSAMSTLSEMK